MRRSIVGGLAAALTAGGLIAMAPPAGAGCLYGGLSVSRCDGPVSPDGTWQRCVVFYSAYGGSGSRGATRCDLMGPDLHPWGSEFSNPPTHIDG
ncbi:hypothetical protein [Mycobacterium sp. E3339]|uniref:CDGP domain-containing protein n=1 Tax=Mycobacterium sp. E3339 TaxID=1834146 RepID=UPI0008023C19|nr:hypothetical protein [Mycobacterium sp. E3339]OBG59462.1 hypothetical protein A5702_06360 [Mycobacterium sp. E3339]